MIIGTAGHVDHGKTTLVRVLTGVDTDRLPEEKRRGMTIDLGYAYSGELSFVDVPGHERFVHTMLAGAGGIDAVLLVVAADDGVMPQTVEHVQILDLLGVDRGVVALSRIDLAPERQAQAVAEILDMLAGTTLAGAPVLPVSAVTGQGIVELRAALAALEGRGRDGGGYPRLAVDRAFTIAGAGLVVTGTLLAGAIGVGDRLVVSPSGLPVRVRGLHAQNRAAERAVAGQRVALNLAGVAKEQVTRGDWILHPDVHAPTAVLDARVRLLPGARAIRGDTTVHVHLAAAHVIARMAPLAGPIGPGGEGVVRLSLERRIGALAMDRVVLRDAGALATIGGGVVLDPWPPRRGARTAGRVVALGVLDRPVDAAFRGLLADGWVDFPAFARARNLTASGRDELLLGAGAVLAGGLALPAGRLEALQAGVVEILATQHREHPEQIGLTPERLRMAMPERLPVPLFRAVVEAGLRRGDLRQQGSWLQLPSHRSVLSAPDERIWEVVRGLVGAQRFSPPRTRDMVAAVGVSEVALRAALHRIARFGRLVEVAKDHFFFRETVAEIVSIAVELEREAGGVTAGAFRDRLGIGRKVAIQVLEFLDGAGVTRREGDARRVRAERVSVFGSLLRNSNE